MATDDKERVAALALIESGSELAGALGATAVALIGGPPTMLAGAAGGVLVTRALKRVGAELASRVLAPRQQTRAGAAFAIATAKIQTRITAGDNPRQDEWFEANDERRAAADELLEGVLLNAADAYEEKKVPVLGDLYASLTFDPTIDRETANLLITLVNRLTYRQLVLAATVGSGRLGETAATAPPQMEKKVFRDAPASLLAELQELGITGVVGFAQPGGEVIPPLGTFDGGNTRAWPYDIVVPTPIGADLFRLALTGVETSEQDELLGRLIALH